MLQHISTIIFDLDDTLVDTWGQLIIPACRDAFAKMVELGLNSNVDLCMDEREIYFNSGNREDFFNHLVKKFGVRQGLDVTAEDVRVAGFMTFYERNVPHNLVPFAMTPAVLSHLQAEYSIYLVTAGSVPTQKRKVETLGIRHFFNHVFYVDLIANETKAKAFNTILYQTNTPPNRVLVVGNRLDQEIFEGKRLGMKTCYIQYGEHTAMQPRNEYETPDYIIRHIGELAEVCNL